MPKYDYLVVGAGLFGAVFARRMTDAGRSCLVIDKRSHIGGNCYTESRNGIDVHCYGPHIFHTNSQRIWNYIQRFADFYPYRHKVKARCGERIYSFPVNLMTLHQLWGVQSPQEAAAKLQSVREKIDNPANFEQWALSQIGRELYDLFIRGYTQKQWGKCPSQLPAAIIKRLPIRLNFNDDYFTDPYQGIPVGGYTAMFGKLLEGIDLRLDTDFFAQRPELEGCASKIVYTGMLDRFFDYSLGHLEWRSLRFQTQRLALEDFQGGAIVNYCDASVPFTRVTEFKHFLPITERQKGHTIVTREFPQAWTPQAEPYYPINTKENESRLAEYRSLKPHNVIFGGRLGDYRYYDMDQAIGSALAKADAELGLRSPAAENARQTVGAAISTDRPKPTKKGEPMKLIYACSTSHRELRDKVFLPSLRRVGEEWDIIEIKCPQTGSGDFQSSDWRASVRARLEGVLRFVRQFPGQVVFLSDVDVQYFRPVQQAAIKCLADMDVVFQREQPSGHEINLGFAAMRCGPRLCGLLEQTLGAVDRGLWDQGYINKLIAEGTMPCTHGRLPEIFANDNLFVAGRAPADMVLYHSILTFPRSGVSSVSQKLRRHGTVAAPMSREAHLAAMDTGLMETRPTENLPAEKYPFPGGRTFTLMSGRWPAAANVILAGNGRVHASGIARDLKSWKTDSGKLEFVDSAGRPRGLRAGPDGAYVAAAAEWSSPVSGRWRSGCIRAGGAADGVNGAWELVPQPPLPTNPGRFQIVVAKFLEDVSWVPAIDAPSVIYSKADADGQFTRLANMGREFGTYLYHIVRHYDALADRTLFLQGDPFPHDLLPLHRYAESDEGFQALMTRSIDLRSDIPWSSPGERITAGVTSAFLRLIDRPAATNPARWAYGAQFAVSRDAVHRFPREYYAGLLEIAQLERLTLSGTTLGNIHIGFLFEIFWREIFGDKSILKVSEEQRTAPAALVDHTARSHAAPDGTAWKKERDRCTN